MKLFLFGLLVAVVKSQTTIDPEILNLIFGKPLTPAPGNENHTTIAPLGLGSTTTAKTGNLSYIFEKPTSTVSTSEATTVPTVPTSKSTIVSSPVGIYVPTVSTSRSTTISTVPTSKSTIVSSPVGIYVPTVSTSRSTTVPTVPTSRATRVPTVSYPVAIFVPTVPTSEATSVPTVSNSESTTVPTVSTSKTTIVSSIRTSGDAIVPTVSTSETTSIPTVSTSGATVVPTVLTSKATIDRKILNMIFDKPLTPSPMTTTSVKEKVVKKNNTILIPIEEKDQPCNGYCVPFHACDTYKVYTDDGAGQLMPRFGHHERSCERAEDVCCSVPLNPAKVNTQLHPVKTLKCGYRNPEGVGEASIYADTQLGEFPWVVAVLDEKWTYQGVGVLISPQVVMTAAHIAANYTTGYLRLRIRAGEWNSQSPNDIFPFQERIVKEIFIHKDYNKIDHRSNNIALLRFEEPLELSEYVNTICMPEQDEVFDSYKRCVANGWGKDTFGLKGRYAVILKKVELNIVPYSRCSILLKNTRLGYRFKLHQSFLCAGGKEGEDTCEGDGGAPLACPIGDNRYKLTGLVAWGVGCGQKDVPGVYTNVPKFREWVDWKMADWGLATASYKI